MKSFLILMLPLSFAIAAFGQAGSGFTNKAEATNQMENGLKEGKWVQYFKMEKGVEVETKSKHAPFYRLTVYKAGKPEGIMRDYYKGGKLFIESTYKNGDRVERKMYNDDGDLMLADSMTDGEDCGVIKVYFKSGKLKIECPFKSDKSDTSAKICFEPYGALHILNGSGSGEFKHPIGTSLNGKVNGVLKMYYANGMPDAEITYDNGVQKMAKDYDPNGKGIK